MYFEQSPEMESKMEQETRFLQQARVMLAKDRAANVIKVSGCGTMYFELSP
jgi:hypothetical protein